MVNPTKIEHVPLPESVVKWVNDLDDLLLALEFVQTSAAAPAGKISGHISKAQIQMQVLRTCVALKRSRGELSEAAAEVNVTLRQAEQIAMRSRVDRALLGAVQLASRLSSRVVKSIGSTLLP